MSVSEKDVARVAELANLELSSGESVAMLRDLNAVLDYFAELNQLDTTGVPPMLQVGEQIFEGEATSLHLRQDEAASSLVRKTVLDCAPDSDGVFFRVPKVIER